MFGGLGVKLNAFLCAPIEIYIYHVQVYELIKSSTSFCLLENHSYISFIKNDKDSTPTSFYVVKVIFTLFYWIKLNKGRSGKTKYSVAWIFCAEGGEWAITVECIFTSVFYWLFWYFSFFWKYLFQWCIFIFLKVCYRDLLTIKLETCDFSILWVERSNQSFTYAEIAFFVG